MKADALLDNILQILYTVKEDKEKLQQILSFLEEKIYEGPEEEEIQLPEKYGEAVSRIADNLSCGLVSFLNMDTLEVEDCPAMLLDDPEEYELITGSTIDDFNLKYTGWKNCLTFEPFHSSESFKIMECFASQLKDPKTAERLIDILTNRKPFAHFNRYINDSKYREDWFAFRQQYYENHVKSVICQNLP